MVEETLYKEGVKKEENSYLLSNIFSINLILK